MGVDVASGAAAASGEAVGAAASAGADGVAVPADDGVVVSVGVPAVGAAGVVVGAGAAAGAAAGTSVSGVGGGRSEGDVADGAGGASTGAGVAAGASIVGVGDVGASCALAGSTAGPAATTITVTMRAAAPKNPGRPEADLSNVIMFAGLPAELLVPHRALS